jgi:aspartate/methionine/tyrosine aminotransferase
LRLPPEYYDELSETLRRRREIVSCGLSKAGWRVNQPAGTYFLLVDLADLGIADDREWAVRLARERGVAGVPGSAFLWRGMPGNGSGTIDRRGRFLRLNCGKSAAELTRAVELLRSEPG